MKTFEEALENLGKKLNELGESSIDQNKANKIVENMKNYITEREKYHKEGSTKIAVPSVEKGDELLKKQAELMRELTSSDMPEMLDDEIDQLGGLLIQDMRALTPKNAKDMFDTDQLSKESAGNVNDATINYYGRKIKRITASFPKGLIDGKTSDGEPNYIVEGGVSTCKDADEFRKKFLPKLIDNSLWREAAVNGCIHLAFSSNYVDRVIVSMGMKARALRLACFFATASREECANLVRACTVLGDELVSVSNFDNALYKLAFGSKGYDVEKDKAAFFEIMKRKMRRKGYEMKKDGKLNGFNRNGLVGLKFHVFSIFPTFLNLSVQDYLRQGSQDQYFFEKRQKDRTSPYGLLANLTVWDQLNQKVQQWDNDKLFSSQSPCHESFAKLLEDMKTLMDMRKPLMERFKNVPVWLRLPKEYKETPVTAKDCVTPRNEMDQMLQMNENVAKDVDALLRVLPEDKLLPEEKRAEVKAVLEDMKSLAVFGSKLSDREISCQKKFDGNNGSPIQYNDHRTKIRYNRYPNRKQNYSQRKFSNYSEYPKDYGSKYDGSGNGNRYREEYGNYNPKNYRHRYERCAQSGYGYNEQNERRDRYFKRENYDYDSKYNKDYGYSRNHDWNSRYKKSDEESERFSKSRSREASRTPNRHQISLDENAREYVPTKLRGEADFRIDKIFPQFCPRESSRFVRDFQKDKPEDASSMNNCSFSKK